MREQRIDTHCKQRAVTRVKLCTKHTCSCVSQGYECAREVHVSEEEVHVSEEEVHVSRDQLGNTCPHCGCNGLCQNRSLQLLPESRVRLEECGPNLGLTLVTCQAVPLDTALIEWRGVVLVDTCHLTGVTCPARLTRHVYHCKHDQLVIDSTIFGNEARFIRRTADSRSVNCRLVEKFIGEELHVIVASKCHIEADTPLYLDEKQFERNNFQPRQGSARALVSMAEIDEDLQSILVDLQKFRLASEPNMDMEEITIEDEVPVPNLEVITIEDEVPVPNLEESRATPSTSDTEQVTPVTVDPEFELTYGYVSRDPFQRLKELEKQLTGVNRADVNHASVNDLLAANVDHVPLNINVLLAELKQWRRTYELNLATRSLVHLPYLEEYHKLAEQFNHVPVFGAQTSLGLIALLKNHVTTMFRFNGGTCRMSFSDAEQLLTCLEQDLRCPYCHAGHSTPLCDTCQSLRTDPSELHFDRYAPTKQSIFASLRAKSGSEWLQEFVVKEIPQKQPLPTSLVALELWHVEHFDTANLSRALVALTNLRVLRLNGTRMQWTAALTALPLWELRLKHCKNLSSRDLQLIGGMTSLRCLDLTGSAMHVTHAFSELRELKELQHLTLDDTSVNDAGLLPLLLTLPLVTLSVQHCAALHLTTLAHLYHMTALQQLRLAQCHVNTPLVTVMLTHLSCLTYLDVMNVNLKVTPSLVAVLSYDDTKVRHVDLRGCAMDSKERTKLNILGPTLASDQHRTVLY